MGRGLKFGPRKLGDSPEVWAEKNAKHIATAGGRFGIRKLRRKGETVVVLEPAPSGSGEGLIPPPPKDQIDMLPVTAAIPVILEPGSPLAAFLTMELQRKLGARKTILAAIRDQAEARTETVVVQLAQQELDRINNVQKQATEGEGA